MISKFFIERPVLANVLAVLMVVIGAVALFRLAVAQYPNVVPPTISVTTRYPGASARAVVDTVGPYLGTVPYVLRSWAKANADTLVGYLAGCIEGLRWILDPANKADAIKLVGERLDVPTDIAAEMVAAATDPVRGLAKDATFDLEGFKTVLKLRAGFEGRTPAPLEKYFDLSFHRRAIAGL